jgi:hypothetical protein
LRANDSRFKNQIAINKALIVAADSAVAGPDSFGEHDHALAGKNWRAKLCILNPAKTDETLPAHELPAIETGQLGGTFDHHDSRKQRSARDMAFHPELIGADVPESDDFATHAIGPDDAVELLHVAALGVGTPNRGLVERHGVEVNLTDIKKE